MNQGHATKRNDPQPALLLDCTKILQKVSLSMSLERGMASRCTSKELVYRPHEEKEENGTFPSNEVMHRPKNTVWNLASILYRSYLLSCEK